MILHTKSTAFSKVFTLYIRCSSVYNRTILWSTDFETLLCTVVDKLVTTTYNTMSDNSSSSMCSYWLWMCSPWWGCMWLCSPWWGCMWMCSPWWGCMWMCSPWWGCMWMCSPWWGCMWGHSVSVRTAVSPGQCKVEPAETLLSLREDEPAASCK